jgi:hypothetical protein
MVRIVLGVIAGFLRLGDSVVRRREDHFGRLAGVRRSIKPRSRQALENGASFTANTTMLLTHIVLASIVSVLAGFLAALIAGENKRAPLVLGFLLLALGLLKAVMSWPYVPIWYHVIFTAILLPMAIIGGKLTTVTK